MADATKGKLKKTVLFLAAPVVARMFLQMLVGLADLAMVGRISPQAIGAVSLGNQLMNLAIGCVTAFTIGTTALVARKIGAREKTEAEAYARQSLLLSLSVGVVLGILGYIFAENVISFMVIGMDQPDLDLIGLGTTYLRIICITLPLFFLMINLNATLQGAGDMKTPLYIMAAINVINIIGDYVLIFGVGFFPELGVAGAAWATGLSRNLGAIVALIYLFSGRGPLQLRLTDSFRPQLQRVKEILNIGIPAAMEHMVRSSGQMVFTMLSAGLGSIALAANQIILKCMSISIMPGFGFGLAATTLVGQNLGARQPERAEQSGWEASKMAAVFMSCVGLLFFFASYPLAGLFTSDLAVQQAAGANLRLLAVTQPAMSLVMVLAGALRGAGDTKWVLFITMAGTWGSRAAIGWFLGIYLGLGLTGIWTAMLLDNVIRAVLMTARYRSGQWKHLKLTAKEAIA